MRRCGAGCASFPVSVSLGLSPCARCAARGGLAVNRKRVRRLWREEGLRVSLRRRKRQRLGIDGPSEAARGRASRPRVGDRLPVRSDRDGRIIKLLHVVDEFTREALAIECARRIDADATVAVLDRLFAARGHAPEHIRCDNGPELTANALRDWCRFSKTGSAYIEPGSPWQNAYVEFSGSRIGDELLSIELFNCLTEAKVLIEDWRCDYNHHRPHSALVRTGRVLASRLGYAADSDEHAFA